MALFERPSPVLAFQASRRDVQVLLLAVRAA
jgi:hypothetical protein